MIEKRSIRQIEKLAFLKRCNNTGILLPSNYKTGIDRDLLILQQKRKLKLSIKLLQNEIKKTKEERKKYFKSNIIEYLCTERKWKYFYINKFNSLFKKQRNAIIALNKKKRKVRKNKEDYKRYKNRQKLKRSQDEIQRANSIILNKSTIVLQDRHKLLLSKGLNFVPTPKWNESVESSEWLSLARHIRTCEWASVFSDETNNVPSKLPKKLKIPANNRPNQDLVDEQTKLYCQMAQSKLRNLEPTVNKIHKQHHNLDKILKESLKELTDYVKNKQIVICRSDKDGKIIIVNYTDYQKLMQKELEKFNEIKELNTKTIDKHFDQIRKTVDEKVVQLHQERFIDDRLLKHIVGMKYDDVDQNVPERQKYSKISGTIAKYFKNNQPAYAYPLIKTHKLKNKDLEKCSLFDIPVRLLQSAGNITTTRATAFIENILQPVSIQFCHYKIDEYCRDSKSYLEILDRWKKTYKDDSTEELFIVAADVQSLYPSINRESVKKGVAEALKVCSDFNPTVINIVVELTMFCLENVVVQNNDKFYNQTGGIITGDNDSVSLANLALHYMLLPISEKLNKTILFKRYIDDIIWISKSQKLTMDIQTTLNTIFVQNDLHLTFRKIGTQEHGKTLEFLDVDHCIDPNSKGGFFTKNFIKPTAIDRVFLNGQSYHPRSVFKSIIFSESCRLRRLNERDDYYLKALQCLEEKCHKSGFNKTLVRAMINITTLWKDRFAPPAPKENQISEKKIWATFFPKLLSITKKEKQLNPQTTIVYRRPKTIGQSLTNYRRLAHNPENHQDQGSSEPCKHCSLCGCYGKYKISMVSQTNAITSKSGETFRLHQNLKCSNSGIYVATCKRCGEQYVGQTCNSFSIRWNKHRGKWKDGVMEDGDKAALLKHYARKHTFDPKEDLAKSFAVTFVEQANDFAHLDMLESRWISKLKASINICKTVLPKYK